MRRNINGKMLLYVYINQILKLVVESQLLRNLAFMLAKNSSNRQNELENNITISQQKEENSLEYFFNYFLSFNFFSIYSC